MSAFSGERERYSFGGWANIATFSSLSYRHILLQVFPDSRVTDQQRVRVS
jgi:hypothetical protein